MTQSWDNECAMSIMLQLTYYMGKKYVKVVTNESVCAFVVACTNDKKFQYGDILKPAGWKTPARNFARGNIFDPVERRFARVRWTEKVIMNWIELPVLFNLSLLSGHGFDHESNMVTFLESFSEGGFDNQTFGI